MKKSWIITLSVGGGILGVAAIAAIYETGKTSTTEKHAEKQSVQTPPSNVYYPPHYSTDDEKLAWMFNTGHTAPPGSTGDFSLNHDFLVTYTVGNDYSFSGTSQVRTAVVRNQPGNELSKSSAAFILGINQWDIVSVQRA